MVDHQVVREGAKVHIIHFKDDTVGDSHEFRTARGTEVYAEVNALSGTIGCVALKVSPNGVAVGLGHQPGIRPWGLLEG